MHGLPRYRSRVALAVAVLVLACHTSARTAAAPLVVSFYGGARHVILLKSDGTVWTWGANFNGLLGDGTTNESHVPIQVHGPGNVGFLTSVVAIMGGEPYNFALRSDGTVWSWGSNLFGNLGDGTTNDSATPVQVVNLSSVIALGGRGYHSLALKSDRTVWAWGYNVSGELGNGSTASSSVPVSVSGLTGAIAITGGYVSSYALMSDHTVRAWGGNNNGQLGDGTTTARMTPVTVPGLTNVVQLSAGWKHVVAVKSDGTVWAWGQNFNGEVGDGTTTDRSTPLQVAGLGNVVAVSGGDCHSAALRADGTVWTWGCNNYDTSTGNDELGDGTSIERHTPVRVSGLTNVVAITARDYHNVALKSDGTVWSWGWNINGQLGDNTTIDRSVPVQVSGLGAAQTISFGAGQYQIGRDIPPGRYYTDPAAGCYWERESGLGGSAAEIIANDFISDDVGQSIVDVRPSDVAFKTEAACGTWFNSARRGSQRTIDSGTWLVGAQITAGPYQANAGSGCYWERVRDFSGLSAAIIANNFSSSAGVQQVAIDPSDTGFTATGSCGAWTTVINFTDNPLQASVTSIKAVHVTELRTYVDQLRARYGLSAYAWTDASLTTATLIRGVHITDLRTALQGVYAAAGLTAPTYSDPVLTAGTTAIKAAHIAEIRNAISAIY